MSMQVALGERLERVRWCDADLSYNLAQQARFLFHADLV